MRYSWKMAALLVASTALAACGDKSDSAADSADPGATVTWSEAFDTSAAGSLSGVWGTGPDDVFIVGGTEAVK